MNSNNTTQIIPGIYLSDSTVDLSTHIDWANLNVNVPDVSFTSGHTTNTISLEGEDADIIINGKSLGATLDAIQQRLAILEPNAALEAEFDQLRALGDQYRALEAKLLEQHDMWSRLKGND
jgi:hypothetical protein